MTLKCNMYRWPNSFSQFQSFPFVLPHCSQTHCMSAFSTARLSKTMPCSATSGFSGGDSGDKESSDVSKLNLSTFLASQMPKAEIGVDCFLKSHPEYDGRGSVIAIFDSGVDPGAAGLQVTSTGIPKIIDVLDCTGSGDIDTSKVVKADDSGDILGASGSSLAINSSWENPSGEWHIGCKLVYELFTDKLTARMKKERRKKWDGKNQEQIAKAVKNLDDFMQKHSSLEDSDLLKIKDDLQCRIDILRKQAESYEDRGPVIDAVVWHDGKFWRAALDTQFLEDGESGKLADFLPLTNYRHERKFGVFSNIDACSFVLNIYDDGNVLSIVTDASPHGTHVAGITAAFHPEEPLLNGVAPGAQLISCKIGDSRLGSMETGTGLTRALIAAVEHKCDLINMSYGEPTLLPDYGRFVDLVNEAVNKYRIIFVSSAGNSGPALSTVGAPGGTTSSILGIGAYVSPDMAAGAHCLVEPPFMGLQYTWSSRGPTVDGDLGVCVSAPGAAVASVPTWTLQKRMLMNGTSMASPSACGAIALLVSAMKAENIFVSSYNVRKAIENTSLPIGDVPEDKLTSGHGLLQVDKAFEYIKKSRDFPCVSYEIKINISGKSKPISRGIYLREASFCRQATEWTVEVLPKFHEGASNLEDLVPFEECIELHSTDEGVVRSPDFVMLTCNGRSFNVVVDPTNLDDGLHYYEVYGIDCKAPWRGPLFRIPITITKPTAVANRPPVVSFPSMHFAPGHIERRYIEVPRGANWVEIDLRTSGFGTTRKLYVDALQICPLQRPIKWESVVTFSSPSTKNFSFSVISGQTMELTVAQFWSSGIGSHEPTIVDLEFEFHGIERNREETLFLDGSENPVRIETEAVLASENICPTAILNKVRIPYRPTDAKLRSLVESRDRLPSGRNTLALTLTYKFKLEEGAEVQPSVPLLNDRIYDNKFESQFYMIYDANKHVYGVGDVYPSYTKLPKGEFNLKLYLRHDDVQILEKLKHLVIFIERKLKEKEEIKLAFFSEPDGFIFGNSSFKSSVLVPGKKEAFYLAPPSKDKLPKNAPRGSVMVGTMWFGNVSSEGSEKIPVTNQLLYVIPPNKIDDDNSKAPANTLPQKVADRIADEVRDAKIKVLSSLKLETDDQISEWKQLSKSLKADYPHYTPLLAKILDGLSSKSSDDNSRHSNENIIDAANEVIDSIDTDELAKYFAQKNEPDDDQSQTTRKKMESNRDYLKDALYEKGLALYNIKEGDAAKDDSFELNFKELRKWADVTKRKYGLISLCHEKRWRRLGNALKVLDGMIEDDNELPSKELYEMKVSLMETMGWLHLATYHQLSICLLFPSHLPLF